jgi:DNA-binding transcriptional ArsR family regulator
LTLGVIVGVPSKQVARTFTRCKPVFFAMGDVTRQQIILLLARAEAETLNVTQLAKKLPLSRPAISHHLLVLRRAGLVGVRRQGTERYYFLTIEDALDLLKRFVAEVEDCED